MSAITKSITIVGVTGNQGSAVAKTFLSTPGWTVRGLTRNVESKVAKDLAAAGVELVQADLDDKGSLIKAFQGTNAIFANTDFFSLLSYPNLNKLLETKYAGLPVNRACMQHEIQQGKNIVDAAADVLAEGTELDIFVLSTLSHAAKWSGGEITELLHFDAKALIENYLREEQPSLASRSRYLQVGFYMANIINPLLLPKKNGQRVYEFQWANMTVSTVFSATCPERDTGVFVRALVSAKPGCTLLGESDPLTIEEYLKIWTEVTGLPARFTPIESSELEASIEATMPSFGKELAQNFQYYRDFTYTGRDPKVLRPADLGINKADLTTFRQYLSAVDWENLLPK